MVLELKESVVCPRGFSGTSGAGRAAHGFSLTEAAYSLGLSRRAVAYYESGAKPVPRVVALALKGFDAKAA